MDANLFPAQIFDCPIRIRVHSRSFAGRLCDLIHRVQLNHIHLGVRDLGAALAWLEQVWQLKPEFQNERMATIVFGSFTLILDAAETDSAATIGFESDDCDRDFRAVVERGALVLDPPSDKPWGSRAAYIQGPGALKFEIEKPPRETLKN